MKPVDIYKKKLAEEEERLLEIQKTRFYIQSTTGTTQMSEMDKRKAMDKSRHIAQMHQDIAAATKKAKEYNKFIEKFNRVNIANQKLIEKEQNLKKEVITKIRRLEEHTEKQKDKEQQIENMRAARIALLDNISKRT